MNRKQILSIVFGVVVVVLATTSLLFERRARVEAAGTQAPRFEATLPARGALPLVGHGSCPQRWDSRHQLRD